MNNDTLRAAIKALQHGEHPIPHLEGEDALQWLRIRYRIDEPKLPQLLQTLDKIDSPVGRHALLQGALALIESGSELAGNLWDDLGATCLTLGEFEAALNASQKALHLTSSKTGRWGSIHHRLGIVYMERRQGNRRDNLELAISHFQHALVIRTHPSAQWASTTHNLAAAYWKRLAGETADNIEVAIQYAEQVQQVRAEGEAWANTMHNLGGMYLERIEGDRAANIEHAIWALDQALNVRIKEDAKRAATLMVHGNAYMARSEGERADNIEQARNDLYESLASRSYDADPYGWAETVLNLGNAHRERIRGARSNNFRDAERYYRQALAVFTPSETPYRWAQAAINLGATLTAQDSPDLPTAISFLQEAMKVLEDIGDQYYWATALMNLGIAYHRRGTPEKIEQALEAYQQAEVVLSQAAYPTDWVFLMLNRGNAYALRIRDERASNIDRAIDIYQQALTQALSVGLSEQIPRLRTQMALAYSKRVNGTKADNLDEAIRLCQQAVETANPAQWAFTQNCLGMFYLEHPSYPDAFGHAVESFQAALTIYRADTTPRRWSQTMNNLGVAYTRHGLFAEAVEVLEQALTVRNQEEVPHQWAQTMTNLGVALEKSDEALNAFEQALTVRKLDLFPTEHRGLQKNICHLHLSAGRWQAAVKAGREAIEAGRFLFDEAYTEPGRRSEVNESTDIYMEVAYALLRQHNVEAALQTIEQGLARITAEALRLNALDELTGDQQHTFKQAYREVQQLEALARNDLDFTASWDDAMRDRLRAARATLRQILEQQTEQPASDVETILALIPEDAVLVIPAITIRGAAILVITPQPSTVHVGWIDALTTDVIDALLTGRDKGWLPIYIAYLEGRIPLPHWQQTIYEMTELLWGLLGGRIHDMCQALEKRPERLIIIPTRGLQILPLHAAWREVDGRRRTLLEDYVVSYSPSGYLLSVSEERFQARRGDRAVIAGVNTYTSLPPLNMAVDEAKQVSTHFGERILLTEKQVTLEALKQHIIGAAYLHLACHGAFSWGGAFQESSVILWHDEALSLRHLLDGELDLSAIRLVVLSACETGIIDLRQSPDEFVGLPTGLLQAGAASVISSLWVVDDAQATILMDHFYRALQQGDHPATALRKAQLATRDSIHDASASTVRFGRPKPQDILADTSHDLFYWAAFTYIGF